jgi:hypothetical protein
MSQYALNCKSKKFLSLSPYIQGDNILYTFPAFTPLTKYTSEKTIVFVGFSGNSDFDEDTVSFIRANKDYRFHFVVRGNNSYPSLDSLENVNVYIGLKTDKLVKLIQESKYILGRKFINYDRFSGNLALAVSFEKPILIDSRTKKAYGIPGISFEKNYSELDLNSIDYETEVNTLRKFRLQMIEQNKKSIHTFLTKTSHNS